MADLFKKFGVSKTAKPGSLIMAAKKKAEEVAETPAKKKQEAKTPGAEGKESAHKARPAIKKVIPAKAKAKAC